jgi:hypothetical protein
MDKIKFSNDILQREIAQISLEDTNVSAIRFEAGIVTLRLVDCSSLNIRVEETNGRISRIVGIFWVANSFPYVRLANIEHQLVVIDENMYTIVFEEFGNISTTPTLYFYEMLEKIVKPLN